MNWRPKEWNNPYQDKAECWEGLCFERGADAILEAISEEIMKVENPFNGTVRAYEVGFERFRQKILSLLKEK